MTIFLTGATGLLGSNLLKYLLEKGYYVKALHRSGTGGNTLLRHPSLEWIEGTLAHLNILEEAQNQADVTIHAAAVVSFDPADEHALYEVNVVGTANMVNTALKSRRLKRFILISSVAALGHPQKNTQVITESNHFDPNGNHSDYAKSKFWAELEVFRAAEEGLNVVLLNPSIILGANGQGRSSEGLIRYALNAPLFCPSGMINYVYIADVVAVVEAAIKLDNFIGKRCILNAGSVSYEDFFGVVARLNKHTPPRIIVGKFLSELGWRMAWLASKFTGKKPLLTRFTAQSSQRKYHYQSTLLPKIMPEFAFTSLERSLKELIDTQ